VQKLENENGYVPGHAGFRHRTPFTDTGNIMKAAIIVLGLGLAASVAQAQTQGLQNGGFEQQCLFCGGPFAEGWHSPGNDQIARRRAVGDGVTPEIFPVGTPNALTPFSGTGLAQIGTYGTGGFEGLTTDTVNFCYCDQTCQTACASPFPFFDPFFDYNGGDVIVSAYYMIPADAPLTGDNAFMKLHVKIGFQDVATFEQGGITGHTNGQWVPFTMVWSRESIQEQYECNTGVRPDCGCACVPLAPLPDHLKIVLGRFSGDGSPTSGTIYWDDVTFVQLPAGGGGCDADVNCDGSPDQGDVACMILSVAGDTSCICQDPDFNLDGSADQGDVAALIGVVAGQPCP